MTSAERSELAHLELRLFGEDGTGGMAGDVREVRTQVAEMRGAIKLIRWLGPTGAAILWIRR